MHAVLLANSSRILYWGYGPRADQSRLWDQATGLYTQPANQPQARHRRREHLVRRARAAERRGRHRPRPRRLLRQRRLRRRTPDTERRAFLFDPTAIDIRPRPADLHVGRFYPTTITLRRRHGADAVRRRQRPCGGRRWPVARDLHPRRSRSLERAEGASLQLLLLPVDVPAARRRPLHRRAAEARPPLRPERQPDRRRPGAPVRPDLIRSAGVNMDGTAVLLPLRPPHYEPRVLVAGGPPAARTGSPPRGRAADRRVDRPLRCDARLAGAARHERRPRQGELRAAAGRARPDPRRRTRRRQTAGPSRSSTPTTRRPGSSSGPT